MLRAILLYTLCFHIDTIQDIRRNRKQTSGVMAEAETSEKGEKYQFPDTLEGFGYRFNENGQLRNIKTDELYQFVVEEGNKEYNQKRYEALGEIVTDYVYNLMEQDQKLKRIHLPVDAEKDKEPQTFFFMSEDAMEKADKLLVLIHGSGAVRAGQWARRLIINDCLESGTQIPYIQWALENGYGVIVANPNLNKVTFNDKETEIRENSSPEEHCQTLWENYISKSKAKHIAIVAHSYGGICTLSLVKKYIDDFLERVFAVALTDSVHAVAAKKITDTVQKFYKQKCRNWSSSMDELDTPIETFMDFCPTVSAGTDRHDYTSHSCKNSVFKFFDKQFAKVPKEDKSKDEETVKSDKKVTVEKPKPSKAVRDLLSSSDAKLLGHVNKVEPMSQGDSQSNDVHMDSQKDEL